MIRASGKLGQSVETLDRFNARITVIPGATDEREVIKRALAGCGGVFTMLVPRGAHGYSTGSTQAVLDDGESHCLPVWSRHGRDPVLESKHHAPSGLRSVHGGGDRKRRV